MALLKVEQGHFKRQLIFLEIVLSIVNPVNKVYSPAYHILFSKDA